MDGGCMMKVHTHARREALHGGPATAHASGRAPGGVGRAWLGWNAAFVMLVGASALGFALAPGDVPTKAYLALHGLCAQNPARIFAFSGLPLPVDARMTGLYLGCLLAAGPLLLARRRGIGVGRGWLVALVAGVAVMALDGLNSLRVDVWLPAWWPPDNRLRLVTGLVAGAGLGVTVVWLVNLALWPAPKSLLLPWDVGIWSAGALIVMAIVLSGEAWAFVPLTVLLLVGAALTLGGLTLAVLGLATTPAAASEQRPPAARLATIALVVALVEMAALAGGRLALEAVIGRFPAV
jgi:uncharacterized membrane protein